VWEGELLARVAAAPERARLSFSPSGSAIFCFEGKTRGLRDKGSRNLSMAILRARSLKREVENDRCCDTAEVGPATGARVGEKGIDIKDWRYEDGTSGRS
jgi:hypothetical protein